MELLLFVDPQKNISKTAENKINKLLYSWHNPGKPTIEIIAVNTPKGLAQAAWYETGFDFPVLIAREGVNELARFPAQKIKTGDLLRLITKK